MDSITFVAEHMGFMRYQLYLTRPEDGILVPQIDDGSSKMLELTNKDNPFVDVFRSGKVKVINAHFTRKRDSAFGHDTALLAPLISEDISIGVLGLWQRESNKPALMVEFSELALTIGTLLAQIVKAARGI
jgi:hypothetical protein